jgi:hypothetical protein
VFFIFFQKKFLKSKSGNAFGFFRKKHALFLPQLVKLLLSISYVSLSGFIFAPKWVFGLFRLKIDLPGGFTINGEKRAFYYIYIIYNISFHFIHMGGRRHLRAPLFDESQKKLLEKI